MSHYTHFKLKDSHNLQSCYYLNKDFSKDTKLEHTEKFCWHFEFIQGIGKGFFHTPINQMFKGESLLKVQEG